MKNEEKAREILSCSKCPFRTDIGEDTCVGVVCSDYESVMAMAQWKDEQFKAEKEALINKACEWLKENKEHPLIGCEDTGLSGFLTEEFITEFRKEMEGDRGMWTDRDEKIHIAAREHSDNRDNRMSFGCGARWADKHPDAIDMSYLQSWYQDSIDETKEPIWTDQHLEELFNDFYLIPKSK